jgi:hypothetical protein
MPYLKPPLSYANAHLTFYSICSSNHALSTWFNILSSSLIVSLNWCSVCTQHRAFTLSQTSFFLWRRQKLVAKWRMHHLCTRVGNPSICSPAAFRIPACRSEIKHIVWDGLSTCTRRSRMNHDHDSLFSSFAKAKVMGTIWSSGSTAAAIIKVRLYFSVRKVPSTSTIGRRYRNACSVCANDQNTQCWTCCNVSWKYIPSVYTNHFKSGL